MRLFSKAKEQWQFQTERDPHLFDMEKDDWRAAKKAKEAKKAPKGGSKGGKK